jgi:hypothetical protein
MIHQSGSETYEREITVTRVKDSDCIPIWLRVFLAIP